MFCHAAGSCPLPEVCRGPMALRRNGGGDGQSSAAAGGGGGCFLLKRVALGSGVNGCVRGTRRAHQEAIEDAVQSRSISPERVEGIEPSSLAWKAIALPLSYTRMDKSSERAPFNGRQPRFWSCGHLGLWLKTEGMNPICFGHQADSRKPGLPRQSKTSGASPTARAKLGSAGFEPAKA